MNLSEFADEYLGSRGAVTRSIYELERKVAAPISEVFEEDKAAESFLNTTWWQVMMRSQEFYEVLRRAGIQRSFLNRMEMMVVNHGGEGGAYNLMILDPFLKGDSPKIVPEVMLDRYAFVESWGRWKFEQKLYLADQGRERIEKFPSLRRYQQLLSRLEPEDLYGFGVEKNFQILIAKQPKPEFLATSSGIFSSPLGVCPVLGGSPTSTVGVAAEDASGRKGVTICLHAIADVLDFTNIHKGKTQVEIDNVVGTIQSIDLVSDSCFVEIDLPAASMAMAPLTGKSPRNEYATFSGIKSGSNKQAYVQAWSPDIPFHQPFTQLKVFTTAETNPGDSGAPLIDSDGNIIGFSFYRTKVMQQPSYSCWIWADSVFQVHNLI